MRVTIFAAVPLAVALSAQCCVADEVKFNKSLITQLRSPNATIRMAAVKKIGNYGAAAKSAVGELGAVMCRDDGKIANQAAASLAQIGKSAVPELIRVLEQESSTARWRALWALGRMGPAAEKAAPLLKLLLRDLTPRYRAMAAQALGEIGPKAADAVPELCEAMQDTNAEVRKQAMIAIANFGEYAVPTLRQMLRETSDAKSRIIALKACRLLGKNGKKALPELIEILEYDEPPLRAMAAAAIAGIGKPAQKAIPVLLKRLRDKHYPTQRHAFEAIIAIGLNDFPGLLKQLSKINQEVEWAVPFVLRQFGRQAKDVVPHLIKALGSEKDGVRLGAANALERLGSNATAAIPALQKRLGDKNVLVRAAALSALNAVYSEQPFVVKQRLTSTGNKISKDIIQLEKSFHQITWLITQTPQPLHQSGASVLFQTTPARQAKYFRIIEMHLYASSSKSRNARNVSSSIQQLVNQFGPEGVPAIIYGINNAAIYQLGMC